ncbi:MAG TPA: archaemetzincin family Zn-dependent metalloprotease [Planctomycetota bacterium]|jgi:archaemetzincin
MLCLVPIYCVAQPDLLAPLATKLAQVFRLRVEQHPPCFDPEVAYDPSRGQYNSRILLAHLLRNMPKDATRVLGITEMDLFIPVLSFVFGEAQLDGAAAVVSSRRLDNAMYGRPPDRNLLFQRLCKEAVHELGHTYNLRHCQTQSCVMTSSTYADGIDLKSDRFCARCLSALVKP